MAVGLCMVLLSQLVAAGQLLIDQSTWHARLQLSPLKVVGCEGLLGLILTVSRGCQQFKVVVRYTRLYYKAMIAL